jgi:hypothetical protein
MSPTKAKYKLFLLEFVALKFTLDKFSDIIWGFPVTIPGRYTSWPDRPGKATQTKMQRAAHAATQQQQYDESMFLAHLAEVLRRHGVAVRMAYTSSSVMEAITDQLTQLANKQSNDNGNGDVPA